MKVAAKIKRIFRSSRDKRKVLIRKLILVKSKTRGRRSLLEMTSLRKHPGIAGGDLES